MIVIDAKDLILGRLSAYVVKQALLGETVHVVNAEKVVITGNKRNTIALYKQRRERGAPMVGPFFPRMPDRIVKRAMRGMLDYNKPSGKSAFARIRCHIGVPESLKDKEAVSFPKMSVDKTHAQYIYIAEISKELGAKF
ncbi:50S ribosomal protein L13 [Candidatus Woesearchaeota archaeon]|nr:50S ribosomal protein L13 [Candidatus Woesearchaeota archaeon]